MIVFNESNSTPQTYLNRLKNFVEQRYSSSEIYQSSPTIVLELNHIKFDLVPAITNWAGELKIPNNSGGWIPTDPNSFNAKLETKNKENKSLIKPTIRLFKYWNASSGFHFDSFTMEKWICDRYFWFSTNQKDYFFDIIDYLSTDLSYSQRKNNEITRAKDIITNVKQYEKNEMPVLAEAEIRRLFRL